MKRTRGLRIISFAAAVTMLLTALTGCGQSAGSQSTSGAAAQPGSTNGSSASTEQAASSNESVKLRFIAFSSTSAMGMNEETKNAYDEVIAEYESLTGNEIEFQEVSHGDYRTKYATLFAANSAPEVLCYQLEAAWEDYNKGFLLNLNDWLDKENPYFDNIAWKDTFSPLLFDLSVDSTNGVYSFLPDSVNVIRIFYNKDLFAQVGVSAPPTTWKDFIETCEKLKSAGILPFAMPNSSPTDRQVLWFTNSLTGQLESGVRDAIDLNKNGIITKNEQAFGVDEGIIDFTKSPLRDAFDLMKDFSQYWTRDFNSLDFATAQSMWLRGEAAMTAMNSPDLQLVETMEGRDFDYGVMAMPVIMKETNPHAQEKSVVLGGRPVDGLSINGNLSDNLRDASIDFVQYMLSDSVAIKFLKDTYRISSLVGLQADAETQEKLKGFEVTGEDILRNNYYASSTSTEFNQFFLMTGQLYYAGSMSLDDYSGQLNDNFRTAFDDFKKVNNWTKENNYGLNQ